MSTGLTLFLNGGLAMGCFVIGLKFLKFWRLSRDRFFVFFMLAFWVFTFGWTLRVFLPRVGEHAHLIYVPRLIGFLTILIAIIDKNRRTRE